MFCFSSDDIEMERSLLRDPKELAGRIPILGICLGRQAVCEAFGARVSCAKTPMRGGGFPAA